MTDAAKSLSLFLVAAVAIPLLALIAFVGSDDTDDCAPADSSSSSSSSLSPGQKVIPMKKGTFQYTSGFGPRDGVMHQGLDMGSQAGTPMYAAYDGVVDKAGEATGFGQWIVLRHNIGGKRVDTVYGHMFPQDLMVKPGQKVTAGQQIAKVGYNGEVSPPGPGGAHLHFEVWEGGWGQKAIDPKPWLADAVEPGQARPSAPNAPPAGQDSQIVSAEDWNKVAQHESGGNWAINTGNGYYGGLQFSASTWKAFGGDKFAPTADKATPQEQMEVANSTLSGQGWDAWPVTSHQAGVRDKKPAPPGTFAGATGSPPKPTSPAPAAPGGPSDVQTLSGVTDNEGELDVSKPMAARFGSEAHWQTNTVRLARAVAKRFPELQTIGGWRADGGGFSDHPDGRAADIMIPNSGRDQKGVELGNRIQKYVMDNKAVFHVDYTIWRQYYQPAQGPGNVMEDRGDWTQNHFDHVHVTLLPSPLYNGEDLGTIKDRGAGGAGSDSEECPSDVSGNGRMVNVKAGSVPADWARWYNKAGRICPQISASLLASQGHQETGGFQQHVQSPDQAQGPGQFIPDTWATYGKDYDGDGRVDVYSLGDAIMAQGHYMCDLAKDIDGWIAGGQVDPKSGPNHDVRDLYLGAYNAGPGAVQESHGFPSLYPRHFSETRPYAEIIIRNEPKYRGVEDAAVV
ncbi:MULTISPECIES: transglycosylase family protein [Gordonia]|uniref:Peptidase M23 family protein n=1 Tax=Gordonia sihwensis NBRC 108236 TaxID=1223544 RepID=L7LMH2_9ACTN|nr:MULTISPECIES: transglycosylase family protein [Gordonia]AUH70586.1 transglycosylase [Gordonia sp. YC-JH1]WFN95128.1 transglycosylase family protein [Gordonia sihwensis]WFN95151.1 transglycosylase family protein [Gordonia sihwensis]GAC62340.1 hypothetical protein GSI01S_33_00260 [Gordonia sihwensis NBRC 108236]